MPAKLREFLNLSEARYFAGALEEATRLLIAQIETKWFQRLPAQHQAALRLQLGKLLVAAIFIDGRDGEAARQQLEIARNIGEPKQRAAATDLIGLASYYEQLPLDSPDFTRARAEFGAALQARKAWADLRELSESHFHLGLVAQFSGEAEFAMEQFRQAYDMAAQGNHKVEQSFAVRHIGFLHRAQGQLHAAYDCMAESLRLREEAGMKIYLPFSLLALADAALALDRSEEAERHYRAAKQAAVEIGNKRAQLLAALGLGRLHRALEDWTEARSSFLSARALAEEMGHQVALREALEALTAIPA
jgi:tetratricopeptide (TPR) repeat protein